MQKCQFSFYNFFCSSSEFCIIRNIYFINSIHGTHPKNVESVIIAFLEGMTEKAKKFNFVKNKVAIFYPFVSVFFHVG